MVVLEVMNDVVVESASVVVVPSVVAGRRSRRVGVGLPASSGDTYDEKADHQPADHLYGQGQGAEVQPSASKSLHC